MPGGLFGHSRVQPCSQKYSASSRAKISSMSCAVPCPLQEGRFAIVTSVGRGMRWTRWRAGRSASGRGRRSRVVLTPRRWRSRSRRRVPRFAGNGGNKARSPGRARSKPLKPLRREGRMNPSKPVATTLVCFFSCTRGRGCGGHPAFPAPSLEGRAAPSVFRGTRFMQQLGRECVAGRRRCALRSWLRVALQESRAT